MKGTWSGGLLLPSRGHRMGTGGIKLSCQLQTRLVCNHLIVKRI